MGRRGDIFGNIDKWIVLMYLILVIMGLMNIFSSTCDPNIDDISFSFATNYGRQAVFIGVSFMIAFIILLTDGRFFQLSAYIFYIVGCILLITVLVVGTKISGAKAWIQLGSFSLQPSEFAKITTALAVSNYLHKNEFKKMPFKKKIILYALILLPVGLIMLEPDAGSALVFLAFFIVFFREGLSMAFYIICFYLLVLAILALIVNQYILIGIIFGLAIIIFLLFMRQTRRIRELLLRLVLIVIVSSGFILSVDYVYDHVLSKHQKDRIEVLLGLKQDLQGVGYNVHQSKIAIGSGGFVGKGYLKGTQTKFDFVPEQQTDFIFCTVGEEFGFIGTFIVVSIFLLLITRIIILSEHQRTRFSRVYGYCVASIFFMHVIINVGMTIGLLPVIGIPLPYFSYGGSSLMAFTILLFIFVKLDSYKYNIL